MLAARHLVLLSLIASAPWMVRAETASAPALQLSAEITLPKPKALPPEFEFKLAPDAASAVRDELPPLPTIDLTTPPDDLWQRVRNGFGMADLNNPLVADRQAWFLNRPEMLRRIFERSRKYLHHIVDELEKRGMPTELALLPIIESSFNPMAHSPARGQRGWK